ncbi:unnamed protein product, partial [Prorocentrum cordatum]
MGFACHARWARCRAAHLSPWARRMNLVAPGNAASRRGIAAAAPAQLLCAELRPALSFPEQSGGAGGPGVVSGVLEGAGTGADEEDGVALLIRQLQTDGVVAQLLTSVLEVCERCRAAHRASPGAPAEHAAGRESCSPPLRERAVPTRSAPEARRRRLGGHTARAPPGLSTRCCEPGSAPRHALCGPAAPRTPP